MSILAPPEPSATEALNAEALFEEARRRRRRRRMWWVAVVLLALIVGIAVAAGMGGGGGHTSGASRPDTGRTDQSKGSGGAVLREGSISGLVVEHIFPKIEGAPRWIPLPPTSPGEAIANSEDNARTVVRMPIAAGGTFHGSLRPGAYRITVVSPRSPFTKCGSTVVIRQSHQSTITIKCEPTALS